MMKKSPSHKELMEVYRKYHERKEETRFDRWEAMLPQGIELGEPALCVKCGDPTEYWSTQASLPMPVCSAVCHDEWWFDYFKEADKVTD